MKPNVTWLFTADGPLGSATKASVSAPIDAKHREVIDGLLQAGYKNLDFVGFEWERWAWPGGYPIYYICADGGVLCSTCANQEISLTTDVDAERGWRITAADINYEAHDLWCDHCNGRVQAAYADPDQEPKEKEDGR